MGVWVGVFKDTVGKSVCKVYSQLCFVIPVSLLGLLFVSTSSYGVTHSTPGDGREMQGIFPALGKEYQDSGSRQGGSGCKTVWVKGDRSPVEPPTPANCQGMV